MQKFKLHHALAALAVAAVLAGCGGGGGGDGGGGSGGSSEETQVPQSAQQSVSGLIDFISQLVASMSDETSEPIALGDVNLPIDETSEPL